MKNLWGGSVSGLTLFLAVACGAKDEGSGSDGDSANGGVPDVGRGAGDGGGGQSGSGSSQGSGASSDGSGASSSSCTDTMCGAECADVQTDNMHCGECGTVCSEYEACQSGECLRVSCPDALELCSGSCLDTTDDEANCGGCGDACDPSYVCSSSTCGCEAPRTECDGFCTVTDVDRQHCGGCAGNGGTVCADDEACLAGTCGTIGIPSEIYCDPTQTWDAEATAIEFEVLDWVNHFRARGYTCGSRGYFAPAGPLQMQENLRCAARVHSLDMATNNYFDHDSQNGDSPWDRIKKAGLDGGSGENIAAGQRTPEGVVRGWMDSDGHCSNIMNPRFTEIGVGYVLDESSDYGRYWTQTFN